MARKKRTIREAVDSKKFVQELVAFLNLFLKHPAKAADVERILSAMSEEQLVQVGRKAVAMYNELMQ